MKRFFRSLLKILLIILTVSIIMVTVICIGFAIYIENYVEKNIDEKMFTEVGSSGQTKLYYYEFEDRENRIGKAHELTSEKIYGGYNCQYVKLDDVPKNLINAYIAIEDKRFFEHSGVDWKRSISAGLNYFLHFSDSYGGSTITQQLIKNVTEKDDYSFQRKIQEILWALDLETKMTKEEILELYLNIINLSQGCYGVSAAAEYYFSKDVCELTLPECATIAAITNSPTYYNPQKNPENNKARRDLILREMYAQGYITKEELEDATSKEVVLNVSRKIDPDAINSWYADMVIEDVISDLVESGYSRHMANLIVYTGGLDIYVAMDRDIQAKVEEYYGKTSNFYSSQGTENPQSSLIVIDSKTGDILAVAGGIGDKSGNRIQNFATQTKRPAGSVIKPLSVYAPALEKNIINWASVYDDVPVNFGKYNLDATNGDIREPSPWPANSSGTYRGLTNINYAISHSTNTVSVRTLSDVGIKNSFDFLYDEIEMKSLISREELADGSVITDMDVAALALGQFNRGVTLRELSAGYSIFANDGIYNKTRSYFKVVDSNGKELLNNDYYGKIVISEENAQIMTLMLENVIKQGTAASVSLDEYISCAGKTGTTQNNYDKWFVGYTPEYICGVWYGYEYPKPISDGNKSISIWNDVMSSVYKEKIASGETSEFVMSDNIVRAEYCADSGKLMTTACRQDARGDRAEYGYFVKGDEPKEFCDCHVLVAYDTVLGGIASDKCEAENVKQVGLINVVRSFPMQVFITDAQYVWRDIGDKVPPETAQNLPFFSKLLSVGEYCGISRAEKQFNRYCRYDFDYEKWYP